MLLESDETLIDIKTCVEGYLIAETELKYFDALNIAYS
jgi:hypothetical protein